MTSRPARPDRPDRPDEQFVWIWLPGASEPVVAGRLFRSGRVLGFEYGRSYLSNENAISLFGPEIPLEERQHFPASTDVHGCIADAAPDSWGRRVIDLQYGGGQELDDELTYLARSGSDRIGALDFQDSPTDFVPRMAGHASIDDLAEASARLEADQPLSQELKDALLHGTAIGGARPKALIDDGPRRLIAKFSSSTDRSPVVKAEFIAMQLAQRCGIDVARTELTRSHERDVLLVERFDRTPSGARRAIVSALTILGLSPTLERYGSYELLALKMRELFADHAGAQRELFSRIAFNILCSNTDDHLRNHAAFWNGSTLELTPAYDICPQSRAGEASLATAIDASFRIANLRGLLDRAALFQLDPRDGQEIIDHQLGVIESSWPEVCELAELSAETQERLYWKKQFLNPASLDGYREASS